MKYTFKDFQAGKVDVRCENDEQKKAFLKVCAKHGLLWHSGDKADAFMPRFSVISTKAFNDGRLGHALHPVADACVGFYEIDLSTAPCYQIIIESDGDTTTAKMVVNGKEIKTATAKRNPADKPNWHIGAQTAFDRLWVKQEKPEKPVKKDGFKVGDRVVCVSDHMIKSKDSVGQHGRIVVFDNWGNIGVEFDTCQRLGHSCDLKAKSGHGRWLMAENLRHEKPTKNKVKEVKRQAKPGEYIKLIKTIYSFDRVGLILRVDKAGSCALVLQKNHPTANSNNDPGFLWAYLPHQYVVLEGYKPGRE